MTRIHAGNFEGNAVYRDIPDEEWKELAEQGFTPEEINQFYKLTDWQQDC